jgi:hypothetical protein
MNKTLSTCVSISSRFIRSVRLDADYGRRDILESFVLQPSAKAALDVLARQINETQQRAFTWTGPYGTGKSSLALALCSLVHHDPKIRSLAKRAINAERGSSLARAFDVGSSGEWTVLPLVGKRAPITEELAASLDRLPKRARTNRQTGSSRDAIRELVHLAESRSSRGVLLVIDELGKFFEHSAQLGTDIYFYQELAEAAARANGKLVVVGILHQSFDQYAIRLGREQRDEWSKVQGRFLDISLTASSDEQIDLIGAAIASQDSRHSETLGIAKRIARSIEQRRSAVVAQLDSKLDACWPLHPVTAALLGPSSRRRFGQNERSIFGFLNSVEPSGFREFLEKTLFQRYSYYSPSQFWDYLRVNFEPAILASSDGHRWALALEAVERAEAKGKSIHVQVVKTVAVIELFRSGSGLAPELEVVASCFPTLDISEINATLHELGLWSIVIYRKHLSAWGIYAGSDFDIEAAVTRARAEASAQDVYALTKSIELPPVLAKRVYQQSGAMHFLTRNIRVIDELDSYSKNFKAQAGSCGEFLLVLEGKGGTSGRSLKIAEKLSADVENGELLIGIPEHGSHIAELSEELFALKHVYASSKELDSDRVAAREISAKIEALQAEIDDLLRDAFSSAQWFWRGAKVEYKRGQSLSTLASKVVEYVYPDRPILLSELINRESPSSNSVKARRDLMYRMLANWGEDRLGYTGFSADAGLYFTILQSTTLHRQENSIVGFFSPLATERGAELRPLWSDTKRRVLKRGAETTLSDLYERWSDPPFGVKAGVAPVLALAFFLANKSSLAVYHSGSFVPDMGTLQVDEWLQDPTRIILRFVEADTAKKNVLAGISNFVSARLERIVAAEPLEVSRGLVSLVLALPGWTKRTTNLSERTRNIRHILLHASDPHRVLFTDLAGALSNDARAGDFSDALEDCLKELHDAFPNMLQKVEKLLLESLRHDSSIHDLNERGRTVAGITGDFRLDAFATRLAHYRSYAQDLESLIGLAVSKPARDWTDQDIESAIMQIGAWAMAFRQAEALAPIQNRATTRHAFAVVFGPGDSSKTLSRMIDVSAQERRRAAVLAKELLKSRKTAGASKDVFLAAIAEAGAILVAEMGKQENPGGD